MAGELKVKDFMNIKHGSSQNYILDVKVNGKSWDEMIQDTRWKVSPYLAVCVPRRLPADFKDRVVPAKTAQSIVEGYFFC